MAAAYHLRYMQDEGRGGLLRVAKNNIETLELRRPLTSRARRTGRALRVLEGPTGLHPNAKGTKMDYYLSKRWRLKFRRDPDAGACYSSGRWW